MENMQQRRRMQQHSPRKKAGGTIITVLLLVTTIVSAALAAVFAIGYVQGKQERNALVAQYEARIAELESAEPAVSDSIELPDAKTSNTSEEYVQVMGDGENAIDISTLLQEKEDELEASIKERMKELVTAEDGSPLKMLRSFFPENLIYADKD